MKYVAALRNFLLQAHYLSLDVVVGALFSHALAARLPDGRQPVHWATVVLLGLSVFIIYAADRLLDVRKGMANTALLTPRHHFHAVQAPQLRRVLAGLAVVGMLVLFWLPKSVLVFGLILAAGCALYVWMVSRLPALHPGMVWKEPLVALIYTIGIWGSAWAAKPAVGWAEIGLGVLFLLIAFQNIVLFSVMESYEYPEGSFSLATSWGDDRTDKLLRALTVIVTLSALVISLLAPERFVQRAAVIEGLMSAMLYFIQRYPAYFLRDSRYRWIGDGVFWLPMLIL